MITWKEELGSRSSDLEAETTLRFRFWRGTDELPWNGADGLREMKFLDFGCRGKHDDDDDDDDEGAREWSEGGKVDEAEALLTIDDECEEIIVNCFSFMHIIWSSDTNTKRYNNAH